MTYTEKELKEIEGLDFNTITTYELDKNKTYLIKLEVEDLSKDKVYSICCDLREKLDLIGIKNVLIVPTFYGQSALNVYELEKD